MLDSRLRWNDGEAMLDREAMSDGEAMPESEVSPGRSVIPERDAVPRVGTQSARVSLASITGRSPVLR